MIKRPSLFAIDWNQRNNPATDVYARTSLGEGCFSFFQLTFLHPPVRVTVGEVRYSIEIDVGGE